MNPDPAADLARIRAVALALPCTAERVSHGQPVFHIAGGRIFAWFLHDHHASGITAVAVKTAGEDEQAMLIGQDAALWYRPPYLAPSGWIGLRLDVAQTDWDHVADRIARSWAMVAPRRYLEAGRP